MSWTLVIVLSLWQNKKVLGCSVQLRLSRVESSEVSRTQQEQQDEKAEERQGRPFHNTYTNYQVNKCKFRVPFVNILPHGFPQMGPWSMAPCRTKHGDHTRKELDHWSDPLGTESQNVQPNTNIDPR